MSSAQVSSTSIDWTSLFQTAAAASKIPDISRLSISPAQVLVRGMVVDLADVQSKIRSQSSTPLPTTIHADVITIPAAHQFSLKDTALILVARRIEINGEARASLSRTNVNTSLGVFASEIAGELKVDVTAQDGTLVNFSAGPLQSGVSGVLISTHDGVPLRTVVEKIPVSLVQQGSDFQLTLTAEFHHAMALIESHPDIALALLNWICFAAAQTAELGPLALQACNLAVLIRTLTSNTGFVPELSVEIYQQETNIFVQAALQYEKQYERFLDTTVAIGDRKAAAQLMVDQIEDTIKYTNALIQQAQKNLNDSMIAVSVATNAFNSQTDELKIRRIGFQAGIDEWKVDQQLEIAKQVVSAIVQFAAATGEIAAGDPDPAGLEAIGRIAAIAADVARVAKELARVLAMLQKIVELITSLSAASQIPTSTFDGIAAQLDALLKSNGSQSVIDPATAWEEFQVKADTAIQIAIDNNVNNAADYKVALDVLAIRGKALAANQAALAPLSQEFLKLLLQKTAAEKQKDKMRALVVRLSSEDQLNTEMFQLFHDRYLDIKRSLFSTILTYQLAFRYWALSESGFRASMVRSIGDSYNDLQSVITDLHQDYTTALRKLSPAPQTLDRKSVIIDDAAVLASLRTTNQASWVIPVSHPAFDAFDRVRVENISVFLQGVTADEILVDISTSGNYDDRFQGRVTNFSGPLFKKTIVYIPGPEPKVTVRGDVTQELRYAFFLPTPFTTWTIHVPPDHNQNLNLSGLTGIEMQFTGSVMRSPE